ncbi:MAG TPA: hypothetical protein VLJ79_12525 [Candidatus Binatia bacterium]|nr:hypothetical protein [Candidatus Binatia bacterium]HSF58690.1 hypothetical protein [Candidatus Binatia bacterium]
MNDQELRWQDEVLQLMYWMRGEHLGTEVTKEQLNRFLGLEPHQLVRTLEQLIRLDLVRVNTGAAGNESGFQLTSRGTEEGERRFRDEFSPYLGKENHLECGDRDCDCHSPHWDGICHLSVSR